jgi:hypothetical protein
MADEVGPLQRHVEEEPQRGGGGVDGRSADLLLRHMQLEAANVLARRGVRRPPEEGGEPSHMADVILLHFLLEPARRMSSIMRWRNELMGLSSIAKTPVSHNSANLAKVLLD